MAVARAERFHGTWANALSVNTRIRSDLDEFGRRACSSSVFCFLFFIFSSKEDAMWDEREIARCLQGAADFRFRRFPIMYRNAPRAR